MGRGGSDAIVLVGKAVWAPEQIQPMLELIFLFLFELFEYIQIRPVDSKIHRKMN
jgi:hypothetical protein